LSILVAKTLLNEAHGVAQCVPDEIFGGDVLLDVLEEGLEEGPAEAEEIAEGPDTGAAGAEKAAEDPRKRRFSAGWARPSTRYSATLPLEYERELALLVRRLVASLPLTSQQYAAGDVTGNKYSAATAAEVLLGRPAITKNYLHRLAVNERNIQGVFNALTKEKKKKANVEAASKLASVTAPAQSAAPATSAASAPETEAVEATQVPFEVAKTITASESHEESRSAELDHEARWRNGRAKRSRTDRDYAAISKRGLSEG
jgi:hypothetical protein